MDPHSPTLKLVFGILGNIIGVGVGLAPMGTFWNIYKKKDTQGFSGLPYVVALLSALIWVLYGLPSVTPHAFLVITINVAISLLQICYLTIFVRYAPKKPKRQIIMIMAALFVFYALLVILTLAEVPAHKRKLTVGSLGVVLGAVSYATPLSVASLVVRTRSVEFLPIILCSCMFINSTVWTCYGIITRDVFLMLPNGLGVVFGVAQLSLYLIFRNAKPVDIFPKEGKSGDDELPKKRKSGDDSVLSMGNKSADKLDEKSVKGDKLDEKSVKGDRKVQSAAPPSQGKSENLEVDSSHGAPVMIAVIVDKCFSPEASRHSNWA